MFEYNYKKYQEILSGKCTDIDILMNSHKIYSELRNEAIDLYDTVENKDKWIKIEILSLIDHDITIPFDFEFKDFYLNHMLRFDLINDYLKERELVFDITSELKKVYNVYMLDNKLDEIMHVLFSMITNSINNEETFDFIIDLISAYNHNHYEDKTLLFEISSFIDNKYESNKITYLKNKFPTLLRM